MALRLHAAALTRKVAINGNHSIPVAKLLTSLARLRIRLVLSGQETWSQEVLEIERLIRSGQTPAFRPWLQNELQPSQPGSVGGAKHSGSTNAANTGLASVQPTEWSSSYPQAPDSPWLPQASNALIREIAKLDIDLDDDAMRWLRWACLHRSYLYESMSDGPVSAEALDVLANLGWGWMRSALLDRVKAQRGDFTSNTEVSAVLASHSQAKSALGAWVASNNLAFYGKGEAALLASGSNSRAPETVAMQILGALSIVTASQKPADELLELVSFEPRSPEPDWPTLLGSHTKRPPTYTRRESGPDHNKRFTVTVEVNGRSADATAGSSKAARALAARAYVLRYLPRIAPATPTASAPRKATWPMPYRANLPQHVAAREWGKQAFEVADAGLISQALTHRSWTYEHPRVVAEARQNDYGALATEGSEALTHLVHHHCALRAFDTTFRLPPRTVASPSVTDEAVAKLFDTMPLANGVLRSSGTALTTSIKSDVAQSLVGAAWRANGDLLMERQPVVLAQWLTSFTPRIDPTTQLQEYCAKVKAEFDFDFEQQGRDHEKKFRATVTLQVAGQPQWRGDWKSSKVQAKHSAADGVLHVLFGEYTEPSPAADALLRGMFLAELGAVDPHRPNAAKALTSGQLGVDFLAAGAYDDFARWTQARSRLLPGDASAIASRLELFYGAVLKKRRRDAVKHWVAQNLPVATTELLDVELRILQWRTGIQPARLALLETLLAAAAEADPWQAVLDYVETAAKTLALETHAILEIERRSDYAAHSVALRLSGSTFSDALGPIVNAVDSIVGTASWARTADMVVLTIPSAQPTDDPLTQCGIEAARHAWQDPWLNDVREGLNELLCALDGADDQATRPTAAQLTGIVAAEEALMNRLRPQKSQTRTGTSVPELSPESPMGSP
ncbi:dsRNA-specific ribonuclease [Nocardia ignorata]|uniref:DsRNA-specific ribonuclease n=2 Tax=Nocardia ignorata TaxID=145285 RepID=A0A4R6P1D7_NOCIG|nr:dsRNA-specific ribonuclease [Nocardia ignorata]